MARARRHLRRLSLCALAGALLSFAAPRDAHAFIHLLLAPGAQHVEPAIPQQSPTLVVGVMRGEATLGILPWLHAGAYGEALANFHTNNLGGGFGGMFALRPHIPFSPLDPMAFVSLGYVAYPDALGHGRTEALEGQVGGGVVWHLAPVVDLEARVAYARMMFRAAPSSLGENSIAGILGVALHF